MSQQYPFQCNIAQALNIIGDKWSLLIPVSYTHLTLPTN